VCEASCPSVIGLALGQGVLYLKVGKCFATGSSSVTMPSSRRIWSSVDVNVFVMEAIHT
jgi:hypothetical protein